MSIIKIHELPLKEPPIDDSDIMIVEDTQDTKQISLAQLKLYFSSDEKLNAIMNQVGITSDKLTELVSTAIANMDRDTDAMEARITNLFNDHEGTKRRLGNLIEQFLDALKRIDALESDNESIHDDIDNISSLIVNLTTRIVELEKDNENSKYRLDILESDNERNKKDILAITTHLGNFINEVNQTFTTLNNKIDKVATDATNHTNNSYDDIMRYIDYYHHIGTNPPNFDEPYIGDPIVAAYIHPVGTIFQTSDKNFEIHKWFPGVWKYLGNANYFDDKEQCVVDGYTWERIE